jgi:hypothetical protein
MHGPAAHASCDGYWGVTAAAHRIVHEGLASFAGRTGQMQVAGRDVGRRGRTDGGLALQTPPAAVIPPASRSARARHHIPKIARRVPWPDAFPAATDAAERLPQPSP